ncbi:MAG: cell division protein FtsK, partial [Gammaproteobacteria bacterium HGW-Gammaproteobacteria-6]
MPPTKTPRAKVFTADRPASLWRELPMLLAAPLVLYLLACLVSYSPDDPGWSHAGSLTGALHNFGGIAGAWIADLAFYLSGYMAYLLPITLGGVVWLATHGREADAEHLAPALRLSGMVLLLIVAPGLAQLQWGAASELPADAGGVIGQLVGTGLAHVVGSVGANLFLFSLFFIALT